MIRNRGIAFKLTFFILLSCTVIFAVAFGYSYVLSRQILMRNIEEIGQRLVAATVNKLEISLRSVEEVPGGLGSVLELPFLKGEAQVEQLLRTVVRNNPDIYGSAVAYEPFAFESKQRLFAPYCHWQKESVRCLQLSTDVYDYPNKGWYLLAKEKGKAVWTEPYFDEGGGDVVMATYAAPFYRGTGDDRVLMGVATADISLTQLSKVVSAIRVGRTGHAMLVSHNGILLNYPDEDFVLRKSIFTVADIRGGKAMHRIAQQMVDGKSGYASFVDPNTGEKNWIVYAALPSTDWSLAVLFPQDEVMADVTALNHHVMIMGVVGLVFLFIVIVLIARSITRPLCLLAAKTKDVAEGKLDFDLESVSRTDEVGLLSRSFVTMSSQLKRYIEEMTKVAAARERIKSELAIARRIQMSLIPKAFPPFPDRPEIDVYAVLQPARDVGGDFYDYFFLDERCLCFFIGDVSGKGIPAALFMAITKTLIKTLARESSDIAELLGRVNHELCHGNDSCLFVTIFCGVLDVKTGELTYTNGGHLFPLLIRKGCEAEFVSGGRSMALGVEEAAVFAVDSLQLSPHDTLYLFTDGVTEAMDEAGNFFTEDRLRKDLSQCRHYSLPELVLRTLKKIHLFARNTKQFDDIAMLALRSFGAEGRGPQTEMVGDEIVLSNEDEELQRLADAVQAFGATHAFSERMIHDVNLSLEEIVSNVIRYGYEDTGAHQIRVRFALRDHELSITVIDDAMAFNPLEAPEPDVDASLEERKIGGLGIFFVRRLMDVLEYRRDGGKNVLTMRKVVG